MQARRGFLKSTAGSIAAALLSPDFGWPQHAAPNAPGLPLPAWEPGVLEVHHIDTGRGNSTLVIEPDGTSLLIDAGEAHSVESTMPPARPDSGRRAGEWIARYVRRQLARTGQSDLGRLLLTHLHGDHVGEVTASSPASTRGDYRLTGAADVADALHIREIIDRGWPDYVYPATQKDPSALNYIALVRSLAQRGTRVQQAKAGSLRQLAPLHNASQFPDFSARVLSVNGEVWTGSGEDSKPMFPPLPSLDAAALPNENMCCVSLRLQYGNFRYYTGGDLCCDTVYGRYPWHDIETPVAQAAGPVTVAVANHHGYFDACGPAFTRALQPRIWVLPTWHASHPAISVLANLFSKELYPGERSVFAVEMTPEALLTTDRFSHNLASSSGHVVIRVPQGGQTFMVHVIGAHDERGLIDATFGPFPA